MLLADFLELHLDALVAAWGTEAQALAREGAASRLELLDHVRPLLSAIAKDVGKPELVDGRGEPSRLRPDHAIDDVAREYRVLRRVVLTMFHRAGGDDVAGTIRFDDAIDRALEAAAAQAAAREKSLVREACEAFVKVVGHDLRNPLTAITFGAQTLDKSKTLTPRERSIVARIVRSAKRMARMTSNLVDFTMGRFGEGLPVHRDACDMGAVSREAVDAMLAQSPGRRVAYDATGDLRGNWDRDRVRQALVGLLEQALAPTEGAVRVTVRDAGPSVEIAIAYGASPAVAEQLAEMFDLFARGGAPSATGVALELYIVDRIVRAHGGTPAVRTTSDEGTVVTTAWPRRASGPVPSTP